MASPQTKMKAALLREFNKPYEMGEVDRPSPGDDELLVRVHAAGFCHSDLQVLRGQFGSTRLPMIPSHEPSGTVAAVGARCRGRWAVGDRVGVLNFKRSCRACPGCKLSERLQTNGGDNDGGDNDGGDSNNGGVPDPRFCQSRQMAGFKDDGGFCEYMLADPDTTIRLPDALSHEQAAPLMCAGATVWGALEKATEGIPARQDGEKESATIMIVGIGGLGHLAVQFAKALGYRVIAVDSRAEGRALARDVANPALRPDLVLNSTEGDAAAASEETIRDFTGGEGVAAAVACTDSLAANEWALGALRVRGTLVLLGLPADRWRFDASPIVFRELVLRGSYVAGARSAQRMVDLVGRFGVASHLTVLPFDEIPGITDAYLSPSFKGRLVVRLVDE